MIVLTGHEVKLPKTITQIICANGQFTMMRKSACNFLCSLRISYAFIATSAIYNRDEILSFFRLIMESHVLMANIP